MRPASPLRHSRTVADLPVQPLLPGERKQPWVYRQIAAAIAGGVLQPGDSVPSTRTLAARWGTSRGVVELAFEQLGREGYLVSLPGKGTRVSDALPEHFFQALLPAPGAAQVAHTSAEAEGAHTSAEAGVLHAPAGAEGADALQASANPVRAGQPFIARLPDVQGFDLRAWRRSVVRAARHLEPESLGAHDPRGLPALREGICRHLAVSRGIRCTAGDIIVVTGIRHALDLCAQVAFAAQATVALEDPGYAGAQAIFRLRGLRTVSIAVDTEGMDVAQLRSSQATLAYVTPAHQAPTGVAMSPGRRAALLAWAAERDAWVLEDDYDSDFSYETAPAPALKSQDTAGRVVFCGSFNKSLFPGLRIGYVVAPPALRQALVRVRAATGRANPILDQLALADFIHTGALLAHLRKARVRYQERRDLVVAELLAVGVHPGALAGLHAGFHFVLHLPDGVAEQAVAARAAQEGLAVQGLGEFAHLREAGALGGPGAPGLVIGYTALTHAQARWHGRKLAGVLRAMQAVRLAPW